MVLKIKREQASIEMRFVSEFVETEAHRPVSMRAEQALGSKPEVTTYTFTDDGIEVVTSGAAGGESARRAARSRGSG